MSDSSQGPGWWLASDGKWYPPEQAAGAQPTQPTQATPPSTSPPGHAAPPVGAPPSGPPPGPTTTTTAPGGPVATPPPAKSGSSGKGCIIALAIVGGIVFLGIVGSIVAIGFLGKKASDTISKGLEDKPCKIMTGSDASSVLGGKYDVVELTGFNSLVGVVLDNRVLASTPGCWIRADGDGRTGRVAQESGGKATYNSELQLARGTSTDQGNGMTLETMGYYLKDVDDLGDEAFCTEMAMTGASGVLVRKGDTVTYISVSPTNTAFDDSSGDSIPDLSGISQDNCEVAVKLAKKANL